MVCVCACVCLCVWHGVCVCVCSWASVPGTVGRVLGGSLVRPTTCFSSASLPSGQCPLWAAGAAAFLYTSTSTNFVVKKKTDVRKKRTCSHAFLQVHTCRYAHRSYGFVSLFLISIYHVTLIRYWVALIFGLLSLMTRFRLLVVKRCFSSGLHSNAATRITVYLFSMSVY